MTAPIVASSKQVSYYYVPEVTEGETPANPAFIRIPKKPGELTLKRETFTSEQTRGDRQTATLSYGAESVDGTLETEFAFADFDFLLQAALCDNWQNDVLKVGQVKKPFTVERVQNDLKKYRRFTGCLVNSLNLSVAPNAIVTASFALMGATATYGDAVLSGATYKEPANNDPFDSTGENVALKAQLKINGKPSNVVTSISLKLDNGVAQAHVVGQRAVATTGLGNSSVTGSLAFLYTGDDISDLFINREDVSLEFTLSGKGGSYTFLLPRIKLTSESPGEQDVFTIINSDFQALLDPATGTNLQITRKADTPSQTAHNDTPSAQG